MIKRDEKGKILFIGQYEIISTIARGGYSVVYLVEDTLDSKKRYALKILFQSYNLRRIDSEISVLKLLNKSKKIIPLYKIEKISNKFVFIYELSDDIDMEKYVFKNGKLSEDKVEKVLLDILDVLKFAKSNSIIHHDIKAENIMFWKGKYYLSDWGISKICDEIESISIKTDRMVVAPEAYRGNYDRKFDIYSLGCTLFFLFTGKFVYDLNYDTPLYKVMYSHLYLDIDLPEYISNKFKYLIYKMTQKDPFKRPDIEEIEDILKSNNDEFTFKQSENFSIENDDKIKLYEIMANDKVVYAQNSLATYFLNNGDVGKAKELLISASKLGYSKSMSNLALLFQNEGDFIKSFELMSISANKGYKKAQFYLANMYESGIGIEKDLSLAKNWYQKSALNGYEKSYKKLNSLSRL